MAYDVYKKKMANTCVWISTEHWKAFWLKLNSMKYMNLVTGTDKNELN